MVLRCKVRVDMAAVGGIEECYCFTNLARKLRNVLSQTASTVNTSTSSTVYLIYVCTIMASP